MKPIAGCIFLVLFGAFVALLVTSKSNLSNPKNPVIAEVSAPTTDGITVIIPTNSTTVSFHE